MNAKLRAALQGEGLEPEVVRPLLEEARLAGATLDGTALGLLLAGNVEHLAEQLLEHPDDLSRMERLNKAAKLVRALPFEVNLWKTQNMCYQVVHTHWSDFKEKAGLGDKSAQEWIRNCSFLPGIFGFGYRTTHQMLICDESQDRPLAVCTSHRAFRETVCWQSATKKGTGYRALAQVNCGSINTCHQEAYRRLALHAILSPWASRRSSHSWST